jgi:hypothetical protein
MWKGLRTMNIFEILNQLYTNKSCQWILELEDNEIEPFVIQKFLSMNDSLRTSVRWLDRYVFTLPSKMWLSLAWSVIPKYSKMPFIRYIKKVEEEQTYDYILKEVRKQFQLSDNDYKHNKSRILDAIKKDMCSWFKYYGIPKKYWKENLLDFSQMKAEDKKDANKGLGAWGI